MGNARSSVDRNDRNQLQLDDEGYVLRQRKIFLITLGIAILLFLVECSAWLTGLKILWLWWAPFVMPFLWILWLCCSFFGIKKNLWKLILLWGMIDIAALSVVMAAQTFSDGVGRDGGDYLLFIVFSPLILPIFLLARTFPNLSEHLANFSKVIAKLLLSQNASVALHDWVGFSLLGVIGILLLISMGYLMAFLRDKLRLRYSP